MSQRKSFLLRIDSDLYEALRRWADQEMRSVNGQIEYVLRRAVSDRTGQVLPPSPRETKNPTEEGEKP
jgi:hypothetical protein